MVANTVSVTEERKTEEIHDSPQSPKGAVSEDGQPPAVGDAEGGLQTVDLAAVPGNESAPSLAVVVDEEAPPSASPTSPEKPPVSPPESADGGKKDKQKVSSRFSLFGKKKKKSSSESEDLKNASEPDAGEADSRQKRGSLGRKNKSPKSADASDGDGGKRSSGGPFSFLSLKRNKSKPSSSVPGSESAPTLDVGDGQGERIVYELEDEGNVVAKIRPKSSPSDDKDRRSGTGTAVTAMDEVEATVERPLEPGRHLVVVAIDFGTTFSGYAFSFVPDRGNTTPADGESPARDGPIHMMRRWQGGDPGVINQKTLTALLLTPEGQFQAFGFTARNFYHDLDPTEAQRWMYFDKFKMALHSNPVM